MLVFSVTYFAVFPRERHCEAIRIPICELAELLRPCAVWTRQSDREIASSERFRGCDIRMAELSALRISRSFKQEKEEDRLWTVRAPLPCCRVVACHPSCTYEQDPIHFCSWYRSSTSFLSCRGRHDLTQCQPTFRSLSVSVQMLSSEMRVTKLSIKWSSSMRPLRTSEVAVMKVLELACLPAQCTGELGGSMGTFEALPSC